ncbi:MAG: PHP domain-containing protein [Gemmatimonadota bacterium]|nr:PHP domain-containing protein [Gemmatimonadota bacterium]MDZ4865563.1 PHP domain-containing protein [Gemmatimonadota bacterium]
MPALTGALHVHSAYSHDGRDSLADLRAFAVRHHLSFLAMTDHAEDFDQARFDAFRAECAAQSDAQVVLIPGLEFRFPGFPGLHLLALGMREWMSPGTPAEFLADARRAAGFTIVAHPILPNYQVPADVTAHIDAIEIWNASYNTRYLPDPRAIALFQRLRTRRPELRATVGLDQHDARNFRETCIEMTAEAARDPIAALRSGDYRNVGRWVRLEATPMLGPGSLAMLHVARGCLDVVERAQERIGWWLKRR